MNKRKIPLRKCVVCNERKDKRELLRIVKNKEENIFLDLTGKANGRGAYICKSIDCLNMEMKNSKLSSALKIKIPESIYSLIKEEIEKNG